MKKKESSKEKFEKQMQEYKDEVKSFAEPDVSKNELKEITENIPSSFDQLIQRELVKFDIVVPAVNELAKEFLPLKIQSVEDKDGYSEVTKALRFIVSKRTAVEDKRKELKADSLSYGRAVDARAKEITALLEPIEYHLKDEKNRIDTVIERLKAEEEEKKQAFINNRISILIGLNMFQTMTEFVWKSKLNPDDEETFLRVNLELFSDEDFDTFVDELKQRIDIENNIISQRDAKAKAESEELERERKNIEEEKKQLEHEMKEMREQRAVIRNAQLSQLGLGTLSFFNYWVYVYKVPPRPTELIYSTVSYDEVYNLSKSEWDAKFEDVKNKLAEIILKDEAAFVESEARKLELSKEVEKQKLEEAQKDEEPVPQWKIKYDSQFNGGSNTPPEKKAAAAEAERLASMSDKDLYLDYVSRISNISAPELKTKKWQSYINTITKTIDTFKNIN